MPIGLVHDNDFNLELEKLSSNTSSKKKESHPSDKVITPEIIEMDRPGRDKGDVNIPESLRKIIGETSVLEGRSEALKLANQFGVSNSSVSAYARGATSTASYNSPTQSIISHINKSRSRVAKKASKVLEQALSAISQDKLDFADAKDLSVIAKNMSAVVKDMTPTTETVSDDKTPQFVIFAPQFRDERSFEVVTVSE